MNLTLRSHHATIPPDLREHAEKKLARLERLLPRLDAIVVEVAREETRSAAHRYAVQLTVHAGSSILRAEERAADARIAFDAAADAVSRQARRHQKRLHDWHRGAATPLENGPEPTVEPETDDEFDEYLLGKVVRVKHFEAKPMSQEEALAQMDLIGHDFFLFLDAATSDYALIYKRKDGDYGLLSPRRG